MTGGSILVSSGASSASDSGNAAVVTPASPHGNSGAIALATGDARQVSCPTRFALQFFAYLFKSTPGDGGWYCVISWQIDY